MPPLDLDFFRDDTRVATSSLLCFVVNPGGRPGGQETVGMAPPLPSSVKE